jgi:hypothetical protein
VRECRAGNTLTDGRPQHPMLTACCSGTCHRLTVTFLTISHREGNRVGAVAAGISRHC